MRTKKSLNKKLALKRNTVSNLNRDEMSHLVGAWGGPSEVTVCLTNCISDCPTCEVGTRLCGVTQQIGCQ